MRVMRARWIQRTVTVAVLLLLGLMVSTLVLRPELVLAQPYSSGTTMVGGRLGPSGYPCALGVTSDVCPARMQTDGSQNVYVTGSALTADVNLVQVGGAAVTLGAKAPASSIPVTLDTSVMLASRVNVNLVSGSAGISANNGVMDGTTVRTALATDSPGVASLTTIATQTTTTATQTTTTATNTGTTATNTGTIAGAISAARVQVNAIAGQVGVSGGAGNSDATTLRMHPAGLATLGITGDSVVSGGADDTIADDAGQAVVCVQSVDQDGILCVGDSGGTGVACADAVRFGRALEAGGPGGGDCFPTSAGLTVNGVSGTLSYVWWRVE